MTVQAGAPPHRVPKDSHPPLPASLAYLPALDGFRGAAVVVVVAFHAHWLTGGYLGVDVFFVLSGFLITRLLLDEHRRSGVINLRRFWIRRARRLLPALLILIAVAAVAERARGRLDGPAGGRLDVIGALTYSINWSRLSSGAGYWAQFGGPALLDHTWSLAIEEQFYVVWPLAMVVLLRLVRSSGRRAAVLAAASVACAIWSLVAFHRWSDASRVYMGTDTRAVALLLGATVAALAAWRPLPDGLAIRSMALVSVVTLGIAMIWMRGDALITYQGGLLATSVASAITIAALAHTQPWELFRPLMAAPMLWLGQRSYGIYLWHWPIMVALGVAGSPLSATWRRVLAVTLTLLVAELSYRIVEQPIRRVGLRAFGAPSRCIALGTVGIALTLLAIGLPTFGDRSTSAVPLPIAVNTQPAVTTGVVPSAEPDAPESSGVDQTIIAPRTSSPSAAPTEPTRPESAPGSTTIPDDTRVVFAPVALRPLPAGRRPRVMYVGDSVGWHLALGADEEAERLGIEVINETQPECPLTHVPLRRRTDASSVPLVFDTRCNDVVNAYRDIVRAEQPDVVIMVFGASLFDENEIAPGEWHAPCTAMFDAWFQDGIRSSFDALSSGGATVYWVTQAYYRASNDHRTSSLDDQIDCLNARAIEVAEASNGGLGLLHLGEWTCPDRQCLVERDGFELRRDGTHYRDAGASLANAWMLAQVFETPPWERTPP